MRKDVFKQGREGYEVDTLKVRKRGRT